MKYLHPYGNYKREAWITLAFEGIKNVGAFQFDNFPSSMIAWGTYVSEPYRKKNVGQKLWEASLQMFNPKVIDVCTVTPAGDALIKKLSKKHPQFDWNHDSTI